MTLVKVIYDITEAFPNEEKFGPSSQMQRAAVAIPSNIAEGHLRHHSKEFLHFISIAQGSAAELETQLLVCQSISRLQSPKVNDAIQRVEEVKKILYALAHKLQQKQLTQSTAR